MKITKNYLVDQNNVNKILAEVAKGEIVYVNSHNKDVAVIMSPEKLQELMNFAKDAGQVVERIDNKNRPIEIREIKNW